MTDIQNKSGSIIQTPYFLESQQNKMYIGQGVCAVLVTLLLFAGRGELKVQPSPSSLLQVTQELVDAGGKGEKNTCPFFLMSTASCRTDEVGLISHVMVSFAFFLVSQLFVYFSY